ncbi:MAG: RNA polymerase sigma factor [Bacteroidales bacterium]|nr:RNA polymerase sigma factor [Bacteroidales bacterium]
MTDNELILQLKQKNHEAFKILVNTYQKLVINTCNGLLLNYEDSQDVAQEVFIEAYKSIHNFRNESKISTWLYRIAINKSLNFIRSKKISKWVSRLESLATLKGSDLSSIAGNSSDEPQSNIEDEQRKQILHRALEALPENQRIAFTLNKYEDLSYKEISEVMNISVSAIESLLFRAKKNLQERLIRYYKNNTL